MRKIMLLLLVLVVLPGATAAQDPPARDVELAKVVSVIDGDTIEVDIEGRLYRVRYIGINTPEGNEPCSAEATAANEALVSGQVVAMRRDVSETDRYDRLLRYVYVEGTFVNAALVAGGWAESVHYPPDTAFAAWFDYLDAQAREANLGCHPTGVFEGTTRSVPVEQPPAAQPASWDCRGNLYDCSDFAGRCADLCAYQRACPGDPSHMDGDGDGWMCESRCPPCP